MEKIYAPVKVTTLCRYEHFKRCIESLSRCTGANETELFIGLDYPAKKEHWPGYNKISSYVYTIKGFKEVHVFRREVNYGPLKNSRDLSETISKRFDRYIATEDDNEFSPNFLEYMNGYLEKYKDNPQVLYICGYYYPFEKANIKDSYPYKSFPMKSYNAWGSGSWFYKREKVAGFADNSKVRGYLQDSKLIRKLFKLKLNVIVHRMLQRYQSGACGDLLIRSYVALNNCYCIFPRVSKVRNNGFDGSGLNCYVNESYKQQSIDTDTTFQIEDFELKDYDEILSAYKAIYERGWIINFLCVMEYWIFRIFKINIVANKGFIKLRKRFHLYKVVSKS